MCKFCFEALESLKEKNLKIPEKDKEQNNSEFNLDINTNEIQELLGNSKEGSIVMVKNGNSIVPNGWVFLCKSSISKEFNCAKEKDGFEILLKEIAGYISMDKRKLYRSVSDDDIKKIELFFDDESKIKILDNRIKDKYFASPFFCLILSINAATRSDKKIDFLDSSFTRFFIKQLSIIDPLQYEQLLNGKNYFDKEFSSLLNQKRSGNSIKDIGEAFSSASSKSTSRMNKFASGFVEQLIKTLNGGNEETLSQFIDTIFHYDEFKAILKRN